MTDTAQRCEPIDKWPRVHTCLYDWCPKQSDECARCDAVLAIIRSKRLETPALVAEQREVKP
jgi:hypothetical protein